MRNTVKAMENNISQLVDSIINMPRRERIRACKEMNATVDYFEERQMAGVVSTKNLLTLIRESYTSSAVAGFLANVLRRAAPGGITAALGVGLVMAAQQVLAISAERTSVMAVYLTAAVSFAVLFGVCLPFNAARGVMFAALTAAFVGAAALFGGLFYLEPLSAAEWVALAALVGASWLILAGLNALAVRLYDKRAKKSA